MTTLAPAVTVIVATYNWSSVLPFSIGSILRQTFTDFEVLVVGDGCADDSADVVGSIGDPRVRWINLPANTGHQSAANNEGLRQARGKFVAYLGHDDLWLPHHLATMVAALEGDADLAHGITRMVEPADWPQHALTPRYRPGDWMPPSNVAHRRSLIDRVGGWADYRTLSGDPESDLWRRIHKSGASMVFTPRLGAIKFPAASRRDVYCERPCHEQAAWFERIQRERDIEAVELGSLLAQAVVSPPPLPYGALVRALLARTVGGMRRRLGRSTAPALPGATIDARRRFKGADRLAHVGDRREDEGGGP
jgi:glycosyltransferase involved in cell wall biosynthesis